MLIQSVGSCPATTHTYMQVSSMIPQKHRKRKKIKDQEIDQPGPKRHAGESDVSAYMYVLLVITYIPKTILPYTVPYLIQVKAFHYAIVSASFYYQFKISLGS